MSGMAWPLTMDDFDVCSTGCSLTGCAHRIRLRRIPNGVPTYFMMPDANVSGPIKKDKTFFFFGYQRLHEKKIAQVVAPSQRLPCWAGDFSLGGVGQPIYDPATTRQLANGSWVRDPFPGNIIPLNRFDPVARKLLGLNPWKLPNIASGVTTTGPDTGNPNLEYNELALVFFDDYNTRIDHQFSNNLKVYGSWTHNRQSGLRKAHEYPGIGT